MNEQPSDKVDSEDELLTKLISYVEDFEAQSSDNHALCERDRDYTDHKQLTDEELRILRRRKQPPIQNNYIRKKINFLRGYERKIRTDPKAFPRTPQHEDDAHAATDALRYIADNAAFDVTRSAFWDNYCVEGTGACEVIVSKGKKREVLTPYIHWDRLFWDYHSRKPDFSDAKYTGIMIWDDASSLIAQFPVAKEIINNSFASHYDDTFEDKPTTWVDSKRKRVRVAQIYWLEDGVWHLAFFVKAGFISPAIPSPWLNEDDEPENGMIMQSAYVDREGNRFGEPRFMIETQDAINKRESKMLHLVSQRQTFGNKRAFPDGVRQQKGELAKADGHVEMNGNSEFGRDFGVLPTGDMAQGQFQLLQEAKQEMARTSGAEYATAQSAADSGRAVLAQQNGALIEINPMADGKRQWEMRVYKAWWNRVRQFWTEERWIRVTDDEKNVKFVGLNRPVTVAEAIQEEMGGIPPEYANDPRLQMTARVENPVSELDVDIVIEDSPDIANIQQEEFRNLIDLANVGVTFDQDVYIRASQLRNKQEILERIQGKNDEQAAMLKQQQDAEQQLTREAVIAAIEKDGAQALDAQASAIKKRADAEKVMRETLAVDVNMAETVADTRQTAVETQQMLNGQQ